MTDQHPYPQPSAGDLALAREWAQSVLSGRATAVLPWEEAVARVLHSLLPLQTLADMSVEEREACRWMQADDEPTGDRVVILSPNWAKAIARVLRDTGRVSEVRADTITPRPDLPPLEWPSDKESCQ